MLFIVGGLSFDLTPFQNLFALVLVNTNLGRDNNHFILHTISPRKRDHSLFWDTIIKLKNLNPPNFRPGGFYWGCQCSRTIASSKQVSNIRKKRAKLPLQHAAHQIVQPLIVNLSHEGYGVDLRPEGHVVLFLSLVKILKYNNNSIGWDSYKHSKQP